MIESHMLGPPALYRERLRRFCSKSRIPDTSYALRWAQSLQNGEEQYWFLKQFRADHDLAMEDVSAYEGTSFDEMDPTEIDLDGLDRDAQALEEIDKLIFLYEKNHRMGFFSIPSFQRDTDTPNEVPDTQHDGTPQPEVPAIMSQMKTWDKGIPAFMELIERYLGVYGKYHLSKKNLTDSSEKAAIEHLWGLRKWPDQRFTKGKLYGNWRSYKLKLKKSRK